MGGDGSGGSLAGMSLGGKIMEGLTGDRGQRQAWMRRGRGEGRGRPLKGLDIRVQA